MIKEHTNSLQAGAWDHIGKPRAPRQDKVQFEINIPVVVEFKLDSPEEKEGDKDSVYYEFQVVHEGKGKIIQTSAWTLLAELKKHAPLGKKSLRITKKIQGAKQYFTVEKIDA